MILSKVLITGIGTGSINKNKGKDQSQRKYNSANYIIEGEQYQTDFIARALIEHYHPDKVFLLGTARSMWEGVYESFAGDKLDWEYYLKLDEKIEKSNYQNYLVQNSDFEPINQVMEDILGKNGSHCLLIKYGLNDEEIIYNFNVFQEIAGYLESGDEIYLDITHSFRSLALFQYTMMSFIENLSEKSVEVKGVFYGMLEVSREMDGKTPVVDLKNIYRLNNWIKAMHELESYGNGYLLADLLEEDNKKLAKKMRMFSNLMNINYLGGIRKLGSSLASIKLSDIKQPGQVVKDYLEKYINRFSDIKTDSEFQLEMAQWYFENKRYATGYIVLAESVITGICEVSGLEPTNRQHRDFVKKQMHYYANSDVAKNLVKEYETVNLIRNNIAHALLDRDEKNFRNDIDSSMWRYESLKEKLGQITSSDFPAIYLEHSYLSR